MKDQLMHVVFDSELTSRIDEQDLKVYYNEDLKSKQSNDINLLRLVVDAQEDLQDKLTKLIDDSLLKMTPEQQQAFAKSEIFEKSPYKNDLALEFFKLKVILDYILQNRIERVVLHGPKSEQARFFMGWCAENSVFCEINTPKENEITFKDRVFKTPYISTLLLFLVNIRKSFGKKRSVQKNKDLIVTYFPAYYFREHNFFSKYFEEVSSLLGKTSDWLFIYSGKGNKVKEYQKDLRSHDFDNYAFLEAYFGIIDVFPVLKKYIEVRKEFKTLKLNGLFMSDGVDYFAIFEGYWKLFLNKGLIENLIFERKFKNLLASRSYSRVFYLLEFQPWEQVLIQQLKLRDKETKVFGAMHSVFRHNLMNYYYGKEATRVMSTPDIALVNSSLCRDRFLKNGFSEKHVVDVEAHRFSHLGNLPVIDESNKRTLMVYTSINYQETYHLLSALSSSGYAEFFDSVLVKAHPDLPVQDIIAELPFNSPLSCYSNGMEDSLLEAQTLLVASSSSVLLEALSKGKKVITLLSVKTLPILAVKKHDSLYCCASESELDSAYLWSDSFDTKDQKVDLFVDPELHRWNTVV